VRVELLSRCIRDSGKEIPTCSISAPLYAKM
jgi:hypothetical protein